jgi:hypothetical protein
MSTRHNLTRRLAVPMSLGHDPWDRLRQFLVRHHWLIPLIAALVVVGPVLLPGEVFNLDLIVVRHLDLPSGFWGLGPELPRRLPMWVPISLISTIVPATVTTKALMVGLVVLGWTGMVRLVREVGFGWAQVAGALFALSPFVMTRTVVGHFMVTVPMMILPWLLPTLLRPGRRLGSTFLAASALALGGHFGGSVAVLVVVTAIVLGERERWVAGLGVTIAAQAPWLVPGLAVWAISAARPAESVMFATAADGVAGYLRLSAGGGFWNTYFQVGGAGTVEALIGLTLLVLAVIGTPSLPATLRRPLTALGAVGWFGAAASTMPILSSAYESVSANVLLGIWRESHRLLAVHLLWLAPSAVLGVRRIIGTAAVSARPWAYGAVSALPLAIAVTLAIPAAWGFGGRLEATPLPDGWRQTREVIRSQPGTVLALPWVQYFNLQVGDGSVNRVLNPLPLYLGGDVLSSSDNRLGSGVRERSDPRESVAEDAVRRLEARENIATDLARLGVRWVVVLDTVHATRYEALYGDPGLELQSDADGIALLRVRDWPGDAVRIDGTPVKVRQLTPAAAIVEGEAAVRWFGPGSGGWHRGWRAAAIDDDGLLVLPRGGGLVWQSAMVPALLGQFVPWTIIVVLWWRMSRRPDDEHRASD